ncbi:hypothetical protein [Deinococcus multiflagellatus]|uniref:Uncharacterized protein n=1 Tax=Deinococcus multiflagellatus TaxID=1656887 RepID=A0ABW1ZKN4_9DEIO
MAQQVMEVFGPCAVLRSYRDADVRREPTASLDVRLLNLGPGFLWIESAMATWAVGGQQEHSYLPLAERIEPGAGLVVMTPGTVEGVLKAGGRAVQMGRTQAVPATRMTYRVAVPGQVLEIKLLFKPLAGLSGAFGVLIDPGDLPW